MEGVIIYFASQTSLLIRGSLIGNGNATYPIIFTAANSHYPWANLQLISNNVQLSYCNFTYGGYGGNGLLYALIYSLNIVRYLFGSNINPYNLYVGNSNSYGIIIYGTNNISSSTIENNSAYGILYNAIPAAVIVSNCTIRNSQYGIRAPGNNLYYPLSIYILM